MFYDTNLYKLDNLLYSEISDVYRKLHIPINQLSLIKPNFETPLPQLKPATFPPGFRYVFTLISLYKIHAMILVNQMDQK